MKLHHDISTILKDAGAIASAATPASAVDHSSFTIFEDWIKYGKTAGMSYLANNPDMRLDPRKLFPGAASIICCAFSFSQKSNRNVDLGIIASYALGDDYHDVIRRRLSEILPKLESIAGPPPEPPSEAAELDKRPFRICIDTAPVMERYWAVKSGLGHICSNGMVEVEGYGSNVFLAEILTRYPIESLCSESSIRDPSANEGNFRVSSQCLTCGMCIHSCPGNALSMENGIPTLDARKCISYLTIEHRGYWDKEGEEVMNTTIGRATIFGCDMCLKVCPKNVLIPSTNIPELETRPILQKLSNPDIIKMGQEEFSRIFKGSAIKRAKLAGLKRNVRGDGRKR